MKKRSDLSPSPIKQINITSLVDVTLSILVIFILVTPLIEQGITLQLPATSPVRLKLKKTIIISISKEGEYFLGNRKVNLATLKKNCLRLAQEEPKKGIIVRADRKVAYEKVVKVLDIVKSAGISYVGLATQKR